MLRQFFSWEWISPGFIISGIIIVIIGGFQIMVEITSAENIIPGFVFFLHILTQHTDLPFTDCITVSVGRHMQQKDNQLFSVVCRNSGNAVAPVQIEKLRHARLDRQAPSHRAADTEL